MCCNPCGAAWPKAAPVFACSLSRIATYQLDGCLILLDLPAWNPSAVVDMVCGPLHASAGLCACSVWQALRGCTSTCCPPACLECCLAMLQPHWSPAQLVAEAAAGTCLPDAAASKWAWACLLHAAYSGGTAGVMLQPHGPLPAQCRCAGCLLALSHGLSTGDGASALAGCRS